MKVKKIENQFGSDQIADMEIGIFELESEEYIVIHYNDNGRLIQFEDKKEFSSYIVKVFNDFLDENPEYISNRSDLELLLKFSQMLTV